MKSVFIAGIRKFYDEMNNLSKILNENKIKAGTVGIWDNSKKDTFESEKNALLNAFKKIDEFDIIYILSKKGYIGKTVAMEISYAYAKGKEIISSEKIDELSAQALTLKIIEPKELINYCKQK